MKTRSLVHLTLCATAALLFSGGFSRAAEQVNNIDESDDGDLIVSGNHWMASSFTTDNLSYTLNSVTLPLGGTGPVTLTLSIFGNESGAPTGPALETFAPITLSSSGENLTFNSTGLDLDANSTYWLTLSGTGAGAIGAWFITDSTDQTGNWTIGDTGSASADAGSTWSGGGPDIGKFSVDASPVPEPSPLALVSVSVACFAVWRRRKNAMRA